MTTIQIILPDIKDVQFTFECEPEHAPIRGNCMASGDEAFDEKCAVDIEHALDNGNPWAWCCVKCVAHWRGLSGVDYLGCYSTFGDGVDAETAESMKGEAFAHLLAQIEALSN